MNIAVIGHLVRDIIHRPDGRVIESPGGIAYSIAALAALAPDGSKVLPICRIGRDIKFSDLGSLSEDARIDTSAIKQIDAFDEVHELRYESDGYRTEINHNRMRPLSAGLIKPSFRLDAVLINYIGGDEFPPREIDKIKNRFNVPIFIDFHSLALGMNSNNERFFRRHPRWRMYVSRADILQMNNYELKTIFRDIDDSDDSILKAASKLLGCGPDAIIITRGDRAVAACWKEGKRTASALIEVPRVETPVDPTGCGDTFAAAFLISYLAGLDVPDCCRKAAEMAAKKALFSGLDGFSTMPALFFA